MASSARSTAIAWTFPVLMWLWVCAACSFEWSGNANYSHGWFVAPLAAFLLFRRIDRCQAGCPRPFLAALAWGVLSASALMACPLEVGRIAPLYWRVFPWLIFCVACAGTISAAYLAGGSPWAAATIFPLVFFASGIPWPSAFESPLTTALMRGIASFIGNVLPLVGIPARQDGTMIVLLKCTVGIEEACSGIRSLQSAVMISLAAGEIFHLRNRSRIALVAAGVVLAVLANVGRTLALTLAGVWDGEAGISSIHDTAGIAALVFLAAGIATIAYRLRLPGSPSLRSATLCRPPTPGIAVVAGLWLAGIVAAHVWYLLRESSAPPSTHSQLVHIADAPNIEKFPLPPAIRNVLAPTSGTYACILLPNGTTAVGYHLFWDNSSNNAQQLYHRPDVCMPSAGWKFVGPQSFVMDSLDNLMTRWAVLPYLKNDQRALLIWTSWIDGQPSQFALTSMDSVQKNSLLQLISNGRRTFSYEVAAVMVPYDAGKPPVQDALNIARIMFSRK